jgi:hypothetical protein
VDRALERQRAHGGYFGDALVAMGLLTGDELKWSLADQMDLPFVQLRPENIDRAVAALVPAAWAREHLVLPVLRNGDVVTVVLDNPGDVDKLDEVRRFTGAARVEAALSLPETIRELIDAVHVGSGPAISFERLVDEAVEQGASAMGVSVRPGRAVGWYRTAETVTRALGAEWAAEMESIVSPLSPLPQSPVHGIRSWPALVTTAALGARRVECRAVGRGDALEWSADLAHGVPASVAAARMDDALLPRIRQALAGGGAVLRVASHSASASPEAAVPASSEHTGDAGTTGGSGSFDAPDTDVWSDHYARPATEAIEEFAFHFEPDGAPPHDAGSHDEPLPGAGSDERAEASAETLEATFPVLPAVVLGPDVRSLHLSDRPVAVAPGLLYLLVRGSLSETLSGLASFALQALTLDVDGLGAAELETARRVAPLVAFHCRSGLDAALPHDFDLCLRAAGAELIWS